MLPLRQLGRRLTVATAPKHTTALSRSVCCSSADKVGNALKAKIVIENDEKDGSKDGLALCKWKAGEGVTGDGVSVGSDWNNDKTQVLVDKWSTRVSKEKVR